MPTIAESLLALKQVQLDCRAAIEAKGVTVGAAPFADYPGFISAIGDDATNNVFWEGALVTWDGVEPAIWNEV